MRNQMTFHKKKHLPKYKYTMKGFMTSVTIIVAIRSKVRRILSSKPINTFQVV